VKDPAFLDFPDLIGHLSLKAEGARRQGERFVKACSDLHGHGRIAFLGAVETGIGRNGSVKDGRGTGSIRAHPFNPEDIVSRIGYRKGVREDIPLIDFPKIYPGLFDDHPGAAACLREGRDKPCLKKTKAEQ
jgi:hypothetical protein